MIVLEKTIIIRGGKYGKVRKVAYVSKDTAAKEAVFNPHICR